MELAAAEPVVGHVVETEPMLMAQVGAAAGVAIGESTVIVLTLSLHRC